MFDFLKKTVYGSLFLLLFGGCVLLPIENGRNETPSPEANACGADRLQSFRKPPLSLALSFENKLDLVSQNREEKELGQSVLFSAIPPRLGKERNRVAYTVRKVTYISMGASGKEVHAFFYRPLWRRHPPAIVILPITNGDYFTEHFAEFLADQGFAILRYESRGEFDGTLPRILSGKVILQRLKDQFYAYVVDVLHGIDWLESEPRIDRNRIGIFGISQGAIVGSVVAGIDSRIRSGVFILGGGGLAGILSSTEERRLARIRNRILNSGELSRESFGQEAEALFSFVDPLTYAKCIQPSSMLLVDARFDR